MTLPAFRQRVHTYTRRGAPRLGDPHLLQVRIEPAPGGDHRVRAGVPEGGALTAGMTDTGHAGGKHSGASTGGAPRINRRLGYGVLVPQPSAARISLPDRYRVVRHIANGGMASVWEAHDELLGRDVAVKLLGSHLSEDDRARQRFQREARAAAGLSNHPNVVTIFDVGEHDGRTFMVMELLTGGTRRRQAAQRRPDLRAHRAALAARGRLGAGRRARRRRRPPRRQAGEHAARPARPARDRGLRHRPPRARGPADRHRPGARHGLLHLPRAGGRRGRVTAASDRYALAVVAFELLTGERPFQAENFAAQARAHVEDPPPHASELNPDLPPEVDDVLDRGLDKDPDERWAPPASSSTGSSEAAGVRPAAPADPPRRRRPAASTTAAAAAGRTPVGLIAGAA